MSAAVHQHNQPALGGHLNKFVIIFMQVHLLKEFGIGSRWWAGLGSGLGSVGVWPEGVASHECYHWLVCGMVVEVVAIQLWLVSVGQKVGVSGLSCQS